MISLTADNAPGPLTGFDRQAPYTWVLANAVEGVVNFNPDHFTVDTAGFRNDCHGGTFSVGISGHSLVLHYEPPSPRQP